MIKRIGIANSGNFITDTFKDILNDRNNMVTLLAFHKPKDNPFSFYEGIAIVIQSGLLYQYNVKYLMIGFDYDGKMESKSVSL